MGQPHLLVTGDLMFIQRYAPLLDALREYYAVTPYPMPDTVKWKPRGFMSRLISKLVDRTEEEKDLSYMRLHKSRYAFLVRSRCAERIIRSQPQKPDLILHIFCMFAPFAGEPSIPYVMWLDYTMNLAWRNYRPWAPFRTDQDRYDWLDCERLAYSRAHHIFTTSEIVRNSLIEDYGLHSRHVSVVGSAGSFQEMYQGPKTFGSGQCLFNGSDFIRKGGDLLFQAWPMIRDKLPNVRLVVVGSKTSTAIDGLENVGHVSSPEHMQELFLASDLVIAPARCDPFPTFLLEALNFGVPCVVSDRDGMPEIIADGVTGGVLKRLEPSNIAETVVSLLSDPEKLLLLSEKARESARLRFNWSTVALKIRKVIDRF